MNDGEVIPSHFGITRGGAKGGSAIPVQSGQCRSPAARRVQQIDPDTGKVLRVFGSTEHAARAPTADVSSVRLRASAVPLGRLDCIPAPICIAPRIRD